MPCQMQDGAEIIDFSRYPNTRWDWTDIVDQNAYAASLRCARGCYQRAILDGRESIAGTTLKGAASWSPYWNGYQHSRFGLLKRMQDAGVLFCIERRKHGRQILVLGRGDSRLPAILARHADADERP